MSKQAEGGLEPPVTNASGLTLPIFQQFLSSVGGEHDAQRALATSPAAEAGTEQAGYVMGSDGLFRTKSGQKLTIDITDPSSFSDYATGDQMIAGWLRKAGHRRHLRRAVGHRVVVGHRDRQLPAHLALVADERLALPALQRLAEQRAGDEQRRAATSSG